MRLLSKTQRLADILMLGVVHFLYAATPPPPPPSPQYNLQLYGYNQVRSPHFPPNTCGNKWLDLYNAASHTSGGIGSCGSTWDTTVDDMISVGLQDDPVNMPWPNGTKAREQVVHDFCDCIHCSFLPAVSNLAHPSFLQMLTRRHPRRPCTHLQALTPSECVFVAAGQRHCDARHPQPVPEWDAESALGHI